MKKGGGLNRLSRIMTVVFFMFLAESPVVFGNDERGALARELYDEGNYTACIAECERIFSSGQNDTIPLLELKEACRRKINERMKTGTIQKERYLISSPFRLAVMFYKKQVSPALGERCPLYPSCSTYSMQVLKKYGIMGIPMTGDRLIREARVIKQRRNPLVVNGKLKMSDPVSDHDFWFKIRTDSKERIGKNCR